MAAVLGVENVIEGLERFVGDTARLERAFLDWGRIWEGRAQAMRPWLDHTDAARLGLRAVPEFGRDLLTMHLTNQAPHGIWLELAHGKRFSVIPQSMYSVLPQLLTMLRG